MKLNHNVYCAVAAILSTQSVVYAADTAEEPAATAVGEVVVTAQRRTENLQDVPITVQAMSGEQLQQLQVVSFNDLLKYTPNVSFSGNGPGTGNIFVRGLGSVGTGNQSQSATSPFPNVALYLDDQSMQFPGRNNDVYLVDMERVEILEGPQGTLFGGGAQAGAVRYITNKPKFNAVSGEFTGGYGITAGGDKNSTLSGVLNVPINDHFALRGVVFSEHRGGYIDNVPGTISYLPGTVPFTSGLNPTANNSPVAGTNTNDVTYQGGRLSAALRLNDDWDMLLQQNYQDMQANGYFYAYPTSTDGRPLPKYQLTAFTPAYTKDRYESTALTIDGRIADLLNVVYAGSYMVRNIEGQQDYSNYMRSAVGSYYACIGTGAGYFNENLFPQLAGKPLQCSSPVGNWRDQTRNTHQSHEIRFSTDDKYWLRGVFGAYWEKFVIHDNMNYNYLNIPQCNAANLAKALAGGPDCLSAVGPLPGTVAMDPSLRTDANTAFGQDIQRGYKQLAGFASVDVDIIPKVLTLTGGYRWYHYNEFESGSQYYSETSAAGVVVDHINGACTAAGVCGFPINLQQTETGHRWRANLTWHITQDLMSYFTYSEGFRPGGFNKTSSLPGQAPILAGVAPYIAGDNSTRQYSKQAGFGSDQLINYEIGLKSELLDHHLVLNLSAYTMKWSNIQLVLFDPLALGNTGFNVNGPTYRVKGLELQFTARLLEGLTLEGSTAFNAAEQTDAPCLRSNRATPTNPTPIGQCITQVSSLPYTNPFGVLGTRPPFSPPWMFNVRMRYDWSVAGDYKPFAWVGASHIGPQSNEPASFPDGNSPAQSNPTTGLLRYEIPGYTTYDAAIGVTKDAWSGQLVGSNLGNAYGPTNLSSAQFIKSGIPLRPRVLMFMMGYKF